MSTVPGGDGKGTQPQSQSGATDQTLIVNPNATLITDSLTNETLSDAPRGEDMALSSALSSLPNYVIEKKLGEGGMGAVYRAHQKNLQRTVAIKVLPQRLCSNAMYVARLNREAIVLAKITHPNVIGCYDLGEHEGMRYVVMEYVEGENLGDLIEKRKHLPEIEALYYLKQAVLGLDSANAMGIIHRDIKPDNMLLAKAPASRTTVRLAAGHTLKIADLGLASFTSEETENTRLTTEGSTLGTPHYMSPEQTIGESDLDSRTDQYALGITFYHMVTGILPFTANTIGAVLAKKMTETIADPRAARPELSPSVSLLIQKMTARKKEDRYAHYGDLLQDIENLEHKKGLSVAPLPADRTSLILMPDTLSKLKKLGITRAESDPNSPQPGLVSRAFRGVGALIAKSVMHFFLSVLGLIFILIALVILGKMGSGGKDNHVEFSTKPELKIPNDKSVTPQTPPVVPDVPKPAAKQPDSFPTQLLIEDHSAKGWTYSGQEKDFHFEDGSLALVNLKGWNQAERILPSSEYILRAIMQTPTGADACEVRVGIDSKEYVACGIRLPANAKKVSAYMERRDVKTNALVEALATMDELSVDDPHNFRLQVFDGAVTCFLNNKFFRTAPLSDDGAKSKVLRLGVQNGIAQYGTLEVSPKPVTK